MLELSQLSHRYANGTQALDGIDLRIPTGMFGLLGPNGAGKSTLMRCIASLQTPSEGSIRFGDIDVVREPEKLRQVLGYLPQGIQIFSKNRDLDSKSTFNGTIAIITFGVKS